MAFRYAVALGREASGIAQASISSSLQNHGLIPGLTSKLRDSANRLIYSQHFYYIRIFILTTPTTR